MTSSPTKNAVPEIVDCLHGPIGRHANTVGVFFNPIPWTFLAATLSWLVVMLRQLPCLQTMAGQPVNTFLRLCYTDIPLLYQSRGLGEGADLFRSRPLEYPVLIVAFIVVMRLLTDVLGGVVGPHASVQQQLDAANIFFLLNAISLFVFFLLTVAAHLEMGRGSTAAWMGGVRVRAWDALLIAASPLVMASGLINWDILAVALCSIGLLMWARKRPFVSGIFVGLAFATKFYPLILVPTLFLLCLRSGQMKVFFRFLAGVIISWCIVNVPVMVYSLTGWKYFWTFNADRGPDLGSLWYVIELAGFKIPQVSVFGVVFMTVGGIAIILLTFRAPRRPRLAQIAALVLITFLIFNKVYSPQYVLWLLPFVVLARPKMFDLAVFTVSELLYFCAIWGFLEGVLGPGSGADRLYWLSVFARIGVQAWLAVRIVFDVLRPWQDPVRGPYVDDPIGGVLDHQPDATWMLMSSPVSEAKVDVA